MTRAATVDLVGRYGLAIALTLVGWCALSMACALLGRPLAPSAPGYALRIVAGLVTLVQALCIGGTGPGAISPRPAWPVTYRLILGTTLALFLVWAWDQFLGDVRIPPLNFMPLIGVGPALELALHDATEPAPRPPSPKPEASSTGHPQTRLTPAPGTFAFPPRLA